MPFGNICARLDRGSKHKDGSAGASPYRAFLLFLILCLVQTAFAQPRTMENRFLFIIDTSSAMKSRRDGINQAVVELLKSSMKGEMRNGDTFGVWTYAENLNTDFPRQIWSDETKDQITSALVQYLQLVKFEKRSHLEKIWPGVEQAMMNSERLTIILIHDGSDPVKGTPFDSDINDLQHQYSRQFKSGHDPFVTLISSSNHVFFDYSINFPTSITVPHTADPLPPPATNEPVVVTPSNRPPIVALPAPVKIIVTPDPEAEKSEISAAVRAAAEETPRPAPQPVVRPVITVEPRHPTLQSPAPVASNPPPPAPKPVVVTNAAPAAAAVAETLPSNSPPLVERRASEPPLVVHEVAAGTSAVEQILLFVIALALLTIAVTLVIFMVRRSRGPQQPSLITQSMDRPQ